MVDVVKALALLVEIVIEPVRVRATAMKINVGMTPPPPPPTEGGPMIQKQDVSGRPAHEKKKKKGGKKRGKKTNFITRFGCNHLKEGCMEILKIHWLSYTQLF